MDDQPRSRGTKAAGDSQQHDRGSARPWLQAVADDAGATAVEYALLIAFVSAIIVSAVATLGLTTAGLFVVPCLGGPTCP